MRLLTASILAFTCSLLDASGDEQKLADYGALKALAEEYRGTISVERVREPIGELPTKILSFQVDGLKQYALYVSPAGLAPEAGWPVLIFNHGYVPVPAEHGLRKSSGKRDRPGDYYRGVPAEFARNGFLVIAPDYRGHADSEGAEFAKVSSPLAPLSPVSGYSRDVVALVNALESVEQADERSVFMLGHSMGGAITLNAVSVLGDRIKAASLWSTSMSNYFPFEEKSTPRSFKSISTPFNIHHAVGDTVTPFEIALKVAGAMPKNSGQLYKYSSDKHLIEGDNRVLVFRRDIFFFHSQ